MICLTSLLRITGVTDKDFSLKYDCVAMNHHGVIRHPVRLRRKQPSKECLSQIAWQNWLNLLQTAIFFLRGLCVIAWSQVIHHDRGTSWPVSSNVFFMLRKLLKSGLSRMFLSSRRTLCHCILPLSVSPCPCSPHGPPHPFTFLHVLSTLLPLSLGSFSSVSGFFSHLCTCYKGHWCWYWVRSSNNPTVSLPLWLLSQKTTYTGGWPTWSHFKRVEKTWYFYP